MNFKGLKIPLFAVLGCFIFVASPLDSVGRIDDFSIKPKEPLRFIPAGWPVFGRLTSGFGGRRHPLWRYRHFHHGIDIATSPATPVYATAEGIIKWIGRKGGYGRSVLIDHGNGWETFYAHLRAYAGKVGDVISSGETIGEVGSSGFVTGPHLHYEVRYLGISQNPLHFINEFERPVFSRLENSYREVSFRQD